MPSLTACLLDRPLAEEALADYGAGLRANIMHLCKQHLPPLLEVAAPLQVPGLGITEGTLVLSMLKLLQVRHSYREHHAATQLDSCSLRSAAACSTSAQPCSALQ